MNYLQRLVNWIFRFEDLSPLQDRSYLLRWTLLRVPFGRGRAVYLHKVLASDWSREPHDHPKNFVSIGLKGEYIEELYRVTDYGRGPIRLVSNTLYKAPWFRSFDTGTIHRLRSTGEPTWTLVFVGRKTNDWGFYDTDGTRVPFIDYMRRIYGDAIDFD